LFQRLEGEGRFRFAPSNGAKSVFGDSPVAVVRASGHDSPLLAEELRRALPRLPELSRPKAGAPFEDLVFPGGAAGFIDYERGYLVEGLKGASRPGSLWFGIYDTFAVHDERSATVEIVSWGLTEEGTFDERAALHRAKELEEILRHGDARSAAAPVSAKGVRASLERDEHASRVRRILQRIESGDIYQANLTVRFEAELLGDPVALFETLLRENPSPYATYLETDEGVVISCSPERLLAVRGRELETRPIKGTLPRGESPAEDAALARKLAASEKDRAELLMITDLLRNDLGKVCDFGSVRVTHLREIESFAHVHHLVSTIRGSLSPPRDVFDALGAVFPSGSITGAPKRRAMEILRELEPEPRGVYTGAIGWIGFDRSADFAVAIRSGLFREGIFSFGAGGGIVADSNADAEWNELQWKARAFALALGVDLESRSFGGIRT
jgi:para-aminobenzoate synthetase component 1